MILLTIGTQLPFDRLVEALDTIAAEIDEPVFGQIGRSSYRPSHFEWAEALDPGAFEQKFRAARLIVAHAGIGTVLSAQRNAKPIILFPRQVKYGEHRNDHQLATCAQLEGRPGIVIARTAEELAEAVKRDDLPAATVEQVQLKRDAFAAGLRSEIDSLLAR